MKFRFAIIAGLTVLLAACNFTLAQDVTPPPDYVPPAPVATLGPLFPAQAPSTENGAVIYAEKCAPCHGTTGLGDGPAGIQLQNVTVPAFGLPEIARPASPAQWYTVVTRGNIERFMPPFVESLDDQMRWDVVAYAMTLHMTEEEIAKGQELFETNCANCSTDFFIDQAKMAELSEVELARIVREGNDQVPAFGASLSEDELWAVTAYLRTLSFDTAPVAAAPVSSATPGAITPTRTLAPSGEETPSGTEQAPATDEPTIVAKAGFGNVRGTVENNTGVDLPSDLNITLRGYEHGADPSSGAQEVFTQESAVNEDGSFVFENVEIPANRIFIAELTYDGMVLQSDFAVVQEGDGSVSLPPISLYKKTEDTSSLVIEETRIFLEYGATDIQVFNAYSIRNSGDEIVTVTIKEQNEIPIFTSPQGSSGMGYELMQGSQNLRTETGLFFPPAETPYELLTIASMPKIKEFEFSQEFVLPAAAVTIFVPEGVKVESTGAADLGVQEIQGFNFHIYDLGSVSAGEKVQLTVSGTPAESAAASASAETTTPNQNLLLGAGALGIGLILAGGWLYLRDRNRVKEEESEEEDEFSSSEDVIDAIIVLDDLHRSKKISDTAYQKRRAELKEILKGKM